MARLLFPFHALHFWRVTHFKPTLEVFRHLHNELERAIGFQWEAYKAGPLRTESRDWEDGSPLQEIQFHAGFNSEAWDLDELVGIYLPSLQRASLFLAFYAEAEHALIELCQVIARSQLELPAFKDIDLRTYPRLKRAKGLEKAVRYLDDKDLVGLAPLRKVGAWAEIKAIRDLRNVFAHRNGRISVTGDLKSYGSLQTNLSILEVGRGFVETRIVLEPQFIPQVLDTMNRFAEQVQTALKVKFPLASIEDVPA